MNRQFFAIAIALSLAGCASIEQAGNASYTVRAYTGADGKSACCELAVQDGKEFASRDVQYQTNGRGASLAISEGASKAFKGQALAVKALTVLPVTGLQDLVGK